MPTGWSRSNQGSKNSAGTFVLAGFLLLAAATAWSESAAPAGLLHLKPAAGPDGEVRSLDVTLTLAGADAPAGEALLELPLVVNNVDTAATSIEKLRAADADGALELVAAERDAGSDEAVRQWAPARAVRGDLRVSYRVQVINSAGARGAAPPLEFRTEDGGVSMAGSVFVLRPVAAEPRAWSVRWDLSELPAAAAAATSYGTGDVDIAAPLAPAEFARAFFMAGDIGLYTAAGESPFFGVWQGEPAFDAAGLMRWGENLHGWYGRFFAPPQAEPFGVFMRHNPVNPGGGVSMGNSFVVTYDSDTALEPLKLTLAHEMFHAFVHSLDEPEGLASSWFGEGLAVHYARLLPLRAGQIPPERFLASLNSTAARYYTNALADTPNDEIPRRFWEDTRVRVLPYDRGSMYFAKLDHRLREKAGGEKSLDDLLRRMLQLRWSGEPMDHDAWVRLLGEELGEAGRRELEDMLAGAVVLPEPDAFGPCFTRITKPLRRYELGFEPRVLIENPRIVRGLEPRSAAARAGLQNGDEILKPVPQDSVQGRQDAWLTLEVRRGDEELTIRYQPRGETVDAWQWERVADVPDEACAYGAS